jgi:hypothetical protein
MRLRLFPPEWAAMFDCFGIRVRWIVVGVFLTMLEAYAQVQGPKQFSNRVEGTRPVPTALAQFTPIALTRNAIHFQSNAKLYVRFFVPQASANLKQRVFLKAIERQDSSNYFMEAKSPPWKLADWNVFGPWPTRDVIDGLGIDADNLAVLAGYDEDNSSRVYLPVDIYEDDKQLTQHTYTFHFIAGRPLQSLEVFVTNAVGGRVDAHTPTLKCNTVLNPNCSWCKAGSAQSFTFNLSSFPAGEYHVRLVGYVPRSLESISEDFVLYHHP